MKWKLGKDSQFVPPAGVVAMGFVCLYAVWLWRASWIDPDGYYHAKLVEYLKNGVLIENFEWLPLTVLADNYADQHLLYHLLAVPLAWVLPVPVAVKATTVGLAGAALGTLYWLQNRLNNPWALPLTLYAGLHVMISRIGAVKSDGLSLLLQLAIVYCLISRKPWPLVAISFAYVWGHASWPMAWVIGIAWFVAQGIAARVSNHINKDSNQGKGTGEAAKALASLVLGSVLGLVLNPYFPENLMFYWYQIFDIAVIGAQPELQSGIEWYPMPYQALFWFLDPALILTIAGAATGILLLKKKVLLIDNYEVGIICFFCLMASGSFVACFSHSARFGVYYPGYASLLTGTLWGYLARNSVAGEIEAATVALRSRTSLFISGCLLYTSLHVACSASLWRVGEQWEWGNLRGAAFYLKQHTTPGELVYAPWWLFPNLWYWNSSNHYVAGVDPKFLYAKHPELAVALEQGATGDKPGFIKRFDRFGARFAVLEKPNRRNLNLLGPTIALMREAKVQFTLIYEDKEAVIFERTIEKQ